MSTDYSSSVFIRPDTGAYYSIANGIAREFQPQDQAAAKALAPNAQTLEWGKNTTGYDPLHGGGTTGGAWTVANFQNTVDSYANDAASKANPDPGFTPSPVTPYTNPNTITDSSPHLMPGSVSVAPAPPTAAKIVDTRPGSPTLGLMVPDYNSSSLMSSTPKAGYIKGYDTNNDYAPVYVPAGKYVPGVSLTPKPSSDITPASMGQENGVNLSGPTDTGTGQANSLVVGANTSISEIIKQLTPPQTPEEAKQQSILDAMASLTGEEAKKAADQLTQEQSAGLPQLRQQFADINAQILSKTAEYNALQTSNANRPVTMSSIIGSERAILNAKAADIGLLQAQAQGLQGQISTAQETVNRAIDLKYSSIEASLNTYQAQLNALAPILSKQEKIQAQAQQIMLDNQKQALMDKKAEESKIQNLMLEAVKAGVTDTNVLNGISKSKTYDAALRIATPAMGGKVNEANQLDNAYKLAQIKQIQAVTAKDWADAAKAAADSSNVSSVDVAGWVNGIKNGTFKMSDVPAKLKTAVANAFQNAGVGNTEQMLQTTKTSLDELNDLVTNNKGFAPAVGASNIFTHPILAVQKLFGYEGTPAAGTAAADFDAKLKQVKNDVVLPNLTLLHGLGRVTDREFQALTSAITDLSTNQSESAFKKSLADITKQINDKLSSPQGQVMISPDGTQQVNISDLTPAQIQEAKNAGWK